MTEEELKDIQLQVAKLAQNQEALESDIENLFIQLSYYKVDKTAIVACVLEEICLYFDVDNLYFHQNKGEKRGRFKNKDIESQKHLQAKYWLCSILYHWFGRDINWLYTNYYWFNSRIYITRFKQLFSDATTPMPILVLATVQLTDTVIFPLNMLSHNAISFYI